MALQLIVMLAWFAAITILALAGVDVLVVLVVLLAVAFGMSWIVDPRRAWWGPGPTLVMSDAAARRRYRIVMTIALIIGLVLLWACVMAATCAGLLPAGAKTLGTWA
jgi:hypothetical protein